MSEEIKETYIRMLSHTIHYDCCYDADADNDFEKISDYITSLQQKVEQLEKENKELNRFCKLYVQSLYNADLTKAEKRVEQLENIRKEAIKYMLKNKLYRFKYDDEELFEIVTDKKAKDDLLNILNKGSDKE